LALSFVRQTGSHRHYVKDSLHPWLCQCTVKSTEDLAVHLKQAEITLKELLDNL